jgi:hypothetical protein
MTDDTVFWGRPRSRLRTWKRSLRRSAAGFAGIDVKYDPAGAVAPASS